ncbi:hypothetical protein F5X99DRAFT_370279 [Biscogniauxia marginata]|nr:hypothetical protein F5X99DRAFT_370279 [Biscogniauxia marginata]
MSTYSTNAMYNGQVPQKSQHHYTTNPPTAHRTDDQSLQSYRLSIFNQGLYSTPIVSASSPANVEASRQARVYSETNAILARFNQK